MSRGGDSFLNTGQSSARMAPRAQKQRAAKKEEKEAKRLVLEPSAELIQAVIQNEVRKLINAPYEDEEKMTDAQFRLERRARRLTVKSLLTVENQIKIILRKPATEQTKEKWGRADEQ